MVSKARGSAQEAFRAAVRRELEAIELHEEAARRHDDLAAQLEHMARMDKTEELQAEAMTVAANARERAVRARARAEEVRHRLRSEGVDVDNPYETSR